MANEKEWQQDISTTVDAHTNTIVDHEERITANKVKLDDHEKRIDNIETTSDVGQFATRIQAIEEKNTEQDTSISNLTKNLSQDIQSLKDYTDQQIQEKATTVTSDGNATIIVTKADGTDTNLIINNVAHATNADSATHATNAVKSDQNSNGFTLDDAIVKNIAIDGTVITVTKLDGTTYTLTTLDTDTTYTKLSQFKNDTGFITKDHNFTNGITINGIKLTIG
jgi:hypothetical protein